jgi:hypothetical protein
VGDAAELELNALIQPASAGMGEFAPGAQGESEVLAVEEVVARDAVLVVLGGEDDEEVLEVVQMDREIAGL